LPDVVITGAHASLRTGAAVVHRELSVRLPGHLDGLQIVDDFREREPVLRRLAASGSTPSACCITTSTPLSLRLHTEHLAAFVYDVRWRWTRGVLDRTYRHADLLRTARSAETVFTISHTVAEHLRALRVHEYTNVIVVDLGPGQLQGVAPPQVAEREPTVVLVGSAPHKRNELAAELLGEIHTVAANWRVIGISLSADAEARLRSRIPATHLNLYREATAAQFVDLISSAAVYLALGVSEGFGFPYLEAAYLGTDVIAIRQSLTMELLRDDAILLEGPTPSVSHLAEALDSWDRARVARLQARATTRDWNTGARQVAQAVRSMLDG
jgi:glycosyltransferase involved in cell wall biosynthesis